MVRLTISSSFAVKEQLLQIKMTTFLTEKKNGLLTPFIEISIKFCNFFQDHSKYFTVRTLEPFTLD